MKTVFYVVLGFVCLVAVSFLLELGGLEWERFFQPKRENIKREVFEQTQSYVHGKIQELAKAKLEYESADVDSKAALQASIRHRFAEFDESKINSSELKSFLERMRGY